MWLFLIGQFLQMLCPVFTERKKWQQEENFLYLKFFVIQGYCKSIFLLQNLKKLVTKFKLTFRTLRKERAFWVSHFQFLPPKRFSSAETQPVAIQKMLLILCRNHDWCKYTMHISIVCFITYMFLENIEQARHRITCRCFVICNRFSTILKNKRSCISKKLLSVQIMHYLWWCYVFQGSITSFLFIQV
eukprot:TRINITY_DN5550_c0_g1_i1.p2 TRINITY_DN5550_c0_g1~~TRINITY_DN5550_c0_g1_i1.p2  ORF type:complete len:188 (-),score=-6.58 TRINITY_DN5550_c0_g1_i1:137-700(-)